MESGDGIPFLDRWLQKPARKSIRKFHRAPTYTLLVRTDAEYSGSKIFALYEMVDEFDGENIITDYTTLHKGTYDEPMLTVNKSTNRSSHFARTQTYFSRSPAREVKSKSKPEEVYALRSVTVRGESQSKSVVWDDQF